MIINTRMENDGSAVLTITEKSLTNANATEFRELARPVIADSLGELVVDCSGGGQFSVNLIEARRAG